MIRRTLLGALVKQPRYMDLLMKPHGYNELFIMNNKWNGLIEFTKKTGRSHHGYHTYISSLITIHDGNTFYQEKMEHFLVPAAFHPITIHSTWKKNKMKIFSTEIPYEIYYLLERKHPVDIIYSSHPL
jgi:hypothetical protein